MPEIYDVAVIGGGVTGAGVLRDCAMRGLKSILLEKKTLASGTTSASSRLVHGGLRYLLYDRLTTHVTSWDSGHIVRTAGPMLRRLPILWPVYRGHHYGLELVESLLEAYDPFQKMKLGRPHLRLSKDATLALVPGLQAEGLLGAIAFDEWAVPPKQLVERNVASAARYGAEAHEGVEVDGLLREGANVVGVRMKGAKDGELRARVVVNAGGPSVDKVAKLAGESVALRVRRGTHLVYPGRLTPVGLILEAADRERYVFVLPFVKETLIGPTDVPHEGGAPKASPAEIKYLLDSAKRYFPRFPDRYEGLECGLRPILGQGGDERLLSRDHVIIDHAGAPGLITAAGGKLSSYRLMAEHAADAVCARLGRPASCRTFLETLDGEKVSDVPPFDLPDAGLKAFLSRHPHARELHAMSHLAGSFAAHWFRRGRPVESAAPFWAHFGDDFRRLESSSGETSGELAR